MTPAGSRWPVCLRGSQRYNPAALAAGLRCPGTVVVVVFAGAAYRVVNLRVEAAVRQASRSRSREATRYEADS